jgi:large subunit ribosomal protein L13
LGSKAAQLLIGKDNVDHVDYQTANAGVVIINSDKVSYFHKRAKNKIYYSHSGYPGGFKATSLGQQMNKDSRKVIENAVSGMLPKNKLRKQFMTKLRVFKDNNHNLEAQQPEEVKVT